MEPLSIGASVVGLLIATAQVSKLLTTLLNTGKNVPSLAKRVLREVSDIDAVLAQLRGFLDGSGTGSQSHKQLVMMDQVVVTLANCVMTFSELEWILNSLDLTTQFRARVGWVRQERCIQELLEQLQWSKASLNLMLTTLTCASMDEATESVAALTHEVHQILQTNQELSSRLRNLEDTSNSRKLPSSSSLLRRHDDEDDASTIVPIRRANEHQETIDVIRSTRFAFDFDQDLHDSWVYSRAMRRNRHQSLSSSTRNSFAWSCLSGLSLANISNISLLSLPITGNDLKNPELYGFQNRILEPTATPWHGQLNLTNPKIFHGTAFDVNVSLVGSQFSGKTTIRNQLCILYGDGFQKAERVVYRTVIEKICRDDAFLAIANVENDQSYRRTVVPNPLPSTNEAQDNLGHSEFWHQRPGFSDFQSCPRCCENLATDPRIPRHLRIMGNVPYFATRLDEISSDGYIPTDSDILHATISSTERSLSDLKIDSIRYRVMDTENLFLSPISSERMSEALGDFSYVICSTSLIDYHHTSWWPSMHVFDALCKSIDAPIVLLFTKLDLLYDTLTNDPICNYFPGAPRDMTCDEACNFFADLFQAADRRLKGELHIYFVNATNTDDIEWILRDIREHVSTSASQSSGSLTARNLRLDRRQGVIYIPSFPREMEQWDLDSRSSPTDTSVISPLIAETKHLAYLDISTTRGRAGWPMNNRGRGPEDSIPPPVSKFCKIPVSCLPRRGGEKGGMVDLNRALPPIREH